MTVAIILCNVDNVFFFVNMLKFQLVQSLNELLRTFGTSDQGDVPFAEDWVGIFVEGWEKTRYLFPHENTSIALFPGHYGINGRGRILVQNRQDDENWDSVDSKPEKLLSELVFESRIKEVRKFKFGLFGRSYDMLTLLDQISSVGVHCVSNRKWMSNKIRELRNGWMFTDIKLIINHFQIE